MLGELSSKIINKSDLARSIGVTLPTITDYLDIAAGTFLWRSLPSFEHNITKRIVKMPRGHIRDTGLLHHLLHILEGGFGILPIEINYGSTVLKRQLRALTEFVQEHKLPYGMIINQADSIEWLTDNIIQIPVGYL